LKNRDLSVAKNLLKESLQGAKELKHPELIAKGYLVQSKILALERKVEESQIVFKNAQDVMRENNLTKALEDFERMIH
jgi:hypothetical protein